MKIRCWVFSVIITLPILTQAQSIDLRSLMTPVKHQGERGTCNVFAATAMMEYLIKRDIGKEMDLSEAYAYWLGKTKAPESDYVRGLYAQGDGLAGYLAVQAFRYGAILEEDWPYTLQNWQQSGDIRCRQDDHGEWPLECFTGRPPRDPAHIGHRMEPIFVAREKIAKYLVEQKAPVAMNLMYYFKLFNTKGDAVRAPNAREVQACVKQEKDCGGHVILLVGYNADSKRFIFRNSWGPQWGTNGYGTLPEAYVLNHCESCYHLGNLTSMSEESRQFFRKTTMGVSGKLYQE
ncbi:MAG: C1 family peptidase [Bdellovibrio sp.]|nr:C1 family peptidase [Bdellovibrio sp.]